jgi:hypothetical protein
VKRTQIRYELHRRDGKKTKVVTRNRRAEIDPDRQAASLDKVLDKALTAEDVEDRAGYFLRWKHDRTIGVWRNHP